MAKFISLLAMEKILKESGSKRVSESAKETLAKAVEHYATTIAKKASALSQHANRRTTMPEDIELALKK